MAQAPRPCPAVCSAGSASVLGARREDARERVADHLESAGQRQGVGTGVHDEAVEAEQLGAIELVAERVDRPPPQDGIRRGNVDQVAVVRQDRADLRLAQAPPEERDFVLRKLARTPLPGGLREDLQCLAAAGLRAIDRAR